jgi:hypothetical protein
VSDDQMNYDYAAMDAAFEEMMHIGQKIESDVDGLMDDVERMFQNSDGALMDGYKSRAGTIKEDLHAENLIMKERGKQLTEFYQDMGMRDRKLGDGI